MHGVNQSDIPVLTLFTIFFAVTLTYSFQDCDVGVNLRFMTMGKFFDPIRFEVKSKTF